MTFSNNAKPLVSLCITCYNQAKYIRESIQSAFDQTYSPLEIVVSDDCSTDGTDKIVEEMFSGYHGQHKLIFNRNSSNLFVAKNYEKAFKLAHGEILVTGAGDDISMPNRVETIVAAWAKSNGDVECIMHGFERIDQDGVVYDVSGPWSVEMPLGAAMAYRCDVFKKFDIQSDENVLYEDNIFVIRALLLGKVLSMPDSLIKWRTGGYSTRDDFRKRRVRNAKTVLRTNEYIQSELLRYGKSFEDDKIKEAKLVLERRRRRYETELGVFEGRTFVGRGISFSRMKPENWWFDSPGVKMLTYGRYVPPFGLGFLVPIFVKVVVKLRLARILRWCKRLFRK